MKALTIWQPWAALIAAGAKPFEFRTWPAPRSIQGQRIVIHAGARPVRLDEVEDEIFKLTGPRAAESTLDPGRALPILEAALAGRPLMLSAGLCLVTLGRPTRRIAIDGEMVDIDNWAWPMLDVEPLPEPAPARGAQGFWEWIAARGSA